LEIPKNSNNSIMTPSEYRGAEWGDGWHRRGGGERNNTE